MMNDVKIIKTEENIKDNCPYCGSTDIIYDFNNKRLRCKYCKKIFEPKELNNIKDLTQLKQRIIGSGAKDITSKEHIMTIECTGCGAEVVVDTSVSTQTRCHWCRNYLSINNRIDNGTVPDAILPFSVSKEEAVEEMKKFISTRKKYALTKFLEEFTPDNVLGVYLPYLLVDAKVKGSFEGKGEKEICHYSLSKEDTRYDSEVYNLYRDFELNIDDLSIESDKNILDKNGYKTNNIINSIMPFDTDNCVKFESNYLRGYTSEKRNININDINKEVEKQINEISKSAVEESTKFFDVGVKWDKKDITIEGSQWMSAYLPVWLYIYKEKIGKNEIIHYIAVNGRTKETMGSIPVDNIKIINNYIRDEIIVIIISAILFLLYGPRFLPMLIYSIIIMVVITSKYDSKSKKYRNATAKHHYEKETKRMINYTVTRDEFYETRIGQKVPYTKKY